METDICTILNKQSVHLFVLPEGNEDNRKAWLERCAMLVCGSLDVDNNYFFCSCFEFDCQQMVISNFKLIVIYSAQIKN